MSIPGSASPLFFQTAATAAADFQINRSLRFNGNGNDDPYLERSVSSAGNRRTFTFAAWVKNDFKPGNDGRIFSAGTTTDNIFDITLSSSNEGSHLRIYNKTTTVHTNWNTKNKLRDVAGWFHVVVGIDTTQATQADRVKVYINGVHITENGTTNTLPSQNAQMAVNDAVTHYIGRSGRYGGDRMAGYLADIYFIEGSQLTPTSFGAFDANGVWQAIDGSGVTFGTRGFHLKFDDASTVAALGTDSSGNNNTFTPYNFSVANAAGGAPTVTGTGPGFPSENTAIANLWDGQTSSYPGDFLTAADGGVITITWPSSYPNVTKIEYYSYNGNDRHNVNDGGWSSNSGSGAGYKTAYDGTAIGLNKLQLQKADGASYVKIGAIRINSSTVLTTSNYEAPAQYVDSVFDSPMNGTQSDTGVGGEVSGNYAVWNSLGGGSSNYGTFSEGNTEVSLPASGKAVAQTIFPESGKWYCEMKFVSGGGAGGGLRMGVINEKNIRIDLGSTVNSWAYLADGRVYHNASAPSYGVSSSPGDTLMMALDIDAGKLWYGKNGTWMASGDPANGSNPSQTFTAGQKMSFSAQSGSGTVQVVHTNWGQRAWTYTAPTGFKAVCTTNLATPTIADGSDYFNTLLWTGDGNNTRSLTGVGFNPDLVWFKARNSGNDHNMIDSVRGGNKTLIPNRSNAETTDPIHGYLSSFDSDGFSVTNGSFGKGDVNESNRNYVAWCWDAGSSTVSNTDGSVTSQVRANQTAGFSIVTYTYPSSGTFTVGHGLNAVPGLIISKHRNRTAEWYVWHDVFTSEDDYINLDGTAVKGTATDFWGTSVPGSSTFGGNIGTSGLNGDTDVVYCFAPVAGYSAMGSWSGDSTTGNDQPFIHCGFRPRFILWKKYSGQTDNWFIFDTARDPQNISENWFNANTTSVETSDVYNKVDILSNGFKMRVSNASYGSNTSHDFFFYAVAENPFQANGGLAR